MGKSLIIYSFSLLFVFFISCSRKAEVTPKEEPIIAIIMKCSDIKDQPSCERKTIAGKPCEWVITVGCNEKSTQAPKPAEELEEVVLEEEIEEEPKPAEELEEVVLEEEIEEEPKPAEELEEVVLEEEIEAEPKAEEIEAEEEDNAAIVPTKCSDYSTANNNLDQCGLTKIPNKLCNVQRPKKGEPFECIEVKKCEDIIGKEKAKNRCEKQGCHWYKRATFAINPSCHTEPPKPQKKNK
jgi:hypothetical protein